MTKEKRNVIKDLKKITTKDGLQSFKDLFEIMKTFNDNLMFIQRNQCEQEAYLSLIAEELKIDKVKIQERINKIQDDNEL